MTDEQKCRRVMGRVDVVLYEFLKSHETGMNKATGFVRVPFYDLEEFVTMIEDKNSEFFSESPEDVKMFGDHIIFELDDVFSLFGGSIEDYWLCFDDRIPKWG